MPFLADTLLTVFFHHTEVTSSAIHRRAKGYLLITCSQEHCFTSLLMDSPLRHMVSKHSSDEN